MSSAHCHNDRRPSGDPPCPGASTRVHERVRGDVIQAAADWVAGVLTRQLVPAVLELNYGDAEWAPELKAEPVRASDAAANADRVVRLLGAGVALPSDWLYEHLEIPKPEDGEEVVGGSAPGAGLGLGTGPMGRMGPVGAGEKTGERAGMPQDAPEEEGGGDEAGEAPRPAQASAVVCGRHSRGGVCGGEGAAEGKKAGNGRVKGDPGQAVEDLVRQAVAEAAGVRTRWLEPLAQEMERLIAAARDESLSDEALKAFLEASRRNLPDVFAQLDVGALADHLEAYLGTAAVRALSRSTASAARKGEG